VAEETSRKPMADAEADSLRRLERDVRDLASRGDVALPAYPAVALRVQKAMARPDFGLDEVSHLVGSDAALAADVLRCANSSMYRRGAPVTSLTQAVTRIGAQQVMRLLVASGLATHVHTAGPLAPLRRLIWIEGLASAAVCQELARQRGLRSEEAFALGLLHDFGRIVACSSLESLLEERRLAGSLPADAWAGIVERLHVSLGLLVASRWQLPPLFKDVIAAHHGGAPGSSEDPALLEVVQVSDQVVAQLGANPSVSSDDLACIPALGKFVEREVVARVLRKVPEFVEAFEMPAPAPNGKHSPIAPPATTLCAGERPVRFGVTVNLGRRARQFTAMAIARNGLALNGTEPLPENRLHEATIHTQPGPLRIWTITKLARPEGGGFHVEMHPFALSGVERGLWDALVAGESPRS